MVNNGMLLYHKGQPKKKIIMACPPGDCSQNRLLSQSAADFFPVQVKVSGELYNCQQILYSVMP